MNRIAVKALDHLVLNVRNVEASVEWYTKVLGMRHEKIVPKFGGVQKNILRFGNQKINLRPMTATAEEWFTAKNAVDGTADLCFLVDISPEAVAENLKSLGVEIEFGPASRDGALGEIHSVYCRDPDGSLIEISSY